MRTTLDLDDDVLLAVKEVAHRRGTTIGKVVSQLTRQALIHQSTAETRNGVPLFPRREQGQIITIELVNKLRDEAV